MTVLVIDDDAGQRTTLGGFLRKLGYRVLTAASGEEGLALSEGEDPIHVVLSDIRMPGMDGVEVLRRIRVANPDVAVLLMTAFGTIPQAVEAVKIGAWDYLTKPLDLDDIRVKIVKIERELGLGADSESGDPLPDLSGIVVESAAMKDVLGVLARAALSDATILLLGESGTGKSRIAEWVHRSSSRRSKSFIAVSCAALPETLIESELFGFERGAFTGADRSRPGRFEAADGGTLFLDEIGDVPLPTQIKLLRVLQERVVERLGESGKPRRVDVRIIAATNRDLHELIRAGRFREDLFYRLNVVSVEVPPLRERHGDIPALIAHFLAKHTPAGQPIPTVSPQAQNILIRHAYPGNVRELENAIERAVILARNGVIRPVDLPPTMTRPASSVADDALPDAVEDLERRLILEALHEADGVQTRAAERLGITERNLRYKLRKYRIPTARGST
jgi:two-component system NtrC family response regulator